MLELGLDMTFSFQLYLTPDKLVIGTFCKFLSRKSQCCVFMISLSFSSVYGFSADQQAVVLSVYMKVKVNFPVKKVSNGFTLLPCNV